ncbi:MAG: hypothetical protein HRT37_24265 [Alteromonadaceae bacterium]|nr:hypothetical protein [Alteromonadaceae bacterium]
MSLIPFEGTTIIYNRAINLGLDNAAISLLHQWIQNAWFKDESIRKILDEAKALVAVKNFQSDAGIKWRKN